MDVFSDLKMHQALLNLRENMVHECHQSKDVDVEHILCIINPSDVFTKEMKDNTHFRNLRDLIMVSLQAFLEYSHNVPHISFLLKTPSLLFHTVRTYSSRQSGTQIEGSRTHRSKHSGNPIRSQTGRVKRSSFHFSQQGGVDRSQVNEY